MGMVRRTATKVAAIGLATVGTLAMGSPAKADETDTYYVGNNNVGHCLAIGGASFSNGAIAVQWGCNVLAREQMWHWEHISMEDGAKIYALRNVNSKKCLAIGGGSLANGAQAIQWTCNRDGAEQRWKYDSAGRLRNMNSDKCLAIAGASISEGAHAIQWTCRDVATNPEQDWWRLLY